MSEDASIKAAGDSQSLFPSLNRPRPRPRPPLLRYVALLGLLALFAAGAAWIFSAPFDGKGTISQVRLQASEQHGPVKLHGFTRLGPSDAGDP